MRIAISADHAGLEMKRHLAAILRTQGHEVLDLGTHSTAAVDYPDCAEWVATALNDRSAERGIIVCGSGAGVSIAANKFRESERASATTPTPPTRSVEHDDMNVLCLGARVIGAALAQEIATAFLGAMFSGEERHQRRLNKILAIEERFSRT